MRLRWRTTIQAVVYCAILLWLVIQIIGWLWPASYYVSGPLGTEFWTVVVKDAVEGQDERMLSDRVMVRDHIRDLNITVVGIGEGSRGYRCNRLVEDLPAYAGSVHPTDMTLRRFMGEEREEDPQHPCRPRPPGVYSLHEIYVIHGPLGSRIRIVLPPATFTVHPRGWTAQTED